MYHATWGVQVWSLITPRNITCSLYFHIRSDYIITFKVLPASTHLSVLPEGIVVEGSFTGFPADCPILQIVTQYGTLPYFGTEVSKVVSSISRSLLRTCKLILIQSRLIGNLCDNLNKVVPIGLERFKYRKA